MNEFKTYHPIVNFLYFVFVIGFSMFFMHPICLFISFACAFAYSAVSGGAKAIRTGLMYIIPLMIATALINPLFNHDGVTVITYLPGGNPLTMESIIYGAFAAVMIASVILWFSCYNKVMTSDKFIYLFGRIIPAMSLILSMTLRFVPRFAKQLKVVTNASRCMGKDVSGGSLIKRAKRGLDILSVMVTWSLENAIETSDSMKARGYGLRGRTSFSVFKFDKRDLGMLITVVCLSAYALIGYINGRMYFRFFPSMKWAELTPYSVSVFVSYFVLCICPLVIEMWEVRKWKALRSKI